MSIMRTLMKRKKMPLWHLFVLPLILLPFQAVGAIEFEELRQLNLGTVAVVDNASASSVSVSRSGIVDAEGKILVVSSPTPGRYQVSGFPPNARIELDAEVATLTVGDTGAPEPLTLIEYDANELQSNEFGEVVLQLGATMQTSGSGEGYVDAPYAGNASLVFHWYEPQVGSFVSASKTAPIAARVQTNLILEEVSELNFGTVFARAANGDTASLVLSPDGEVRVSSSGRARIGSLSKPQPATISVTGGAPYASVQITPVSTPVLLKHTALGGAPDFILRSITTDPSADGTIDRDGNLLIHLGGTLQTDDVPDTRVYPEGLYEGQYELIIAY